MKYYRILIKKSVDNKIFVSAVASGLLYKIIQSIYTILSIVLTLPYLGQDRFGIWMLFSSLIQIFSFLDFGFTSSLGNKLIKFKEYSNIFYKRTLFSSLIIMFILSLMASLLLYLLYFLVDINYFISGNTAILGEAKDAYLIFTILFPVSIYSIGIQKIFASMKRMDYANMQLIYGTLMNVISLLIAAYYNLGVNYLVLTNFFGATYVTFVLTKKIFSNNLVSSLNYKMSLKKTFISTKKDSIYFLTIQILTVLAWGADYLFISKKIGIEMVGVFAILQKIFFFVTQPILIVNTPLWMIYGKALTEGNKNLIKNTFYKIIIFNLIFCLAASMILYILIQYTGVGSWMSNYIYISFDLFILYMIWVLIESMGNSIGILFNSHGILFPQIVSMIIYITLSLPFKVMYLSRLGVEGLILSTICFYLISSILTHGFICRNEIICKLKK